MKNSHFGGCFFLRISGMYGIVTLYNGPQMVM